MDKIIIRFDDFNNSFNVFCGNYWVMVITVNGIHEMVYCGIMRSNNESDITSIQDIHRYIFQQFVLMDITGYNQTKKPA